MRYCQLYTGQQMPVLGMGFYQVPVLETTKVASQAIEIGYRLFDTAYYYGNEQGVGQAVRQSGLPRQDFFITSKVNSSGYLATKQAIKQALDKMQLDYLDLMLIHWIVPDYIGTYQAMEEAVSKGLGQSPGLTVPLDAVVSSDGFLYVYRLKPDNHVERVRVTTGRQAADRIEVMPARGEQLSENDRLVVEGAAFLSDADLVQVVNAHTDEARALDDSSANSHSAGADAGSGSPDVKANDADGRTAPKATNKTSAH